MQVSMRKTLTSVLILSLLLTLANAAPAKRRPLALAGGIVFTAGTVGCSVGAVAMFVVAPVIRNDARENNSRSYSSSYYHHAHDGRYYSDSGQEKLDSANTMQTCGVVFTVAAVASAVTAVVSWVNLDDGNGPGGASKRKPRAPKSEAFDESMLQLHEGQVTVQAPALQFEPMGLGVKAPVFAASF